MYAMKFRELGRCVWLAGRYKNNVRAEANASDWFFWNSNL